MESDPSQDPRNSESDADSLAANSGTEGDRPGANWAWLLADGNKGSEGGGHRPGDDQGEAEEIFVELIPVVIETGDGEVPENAKSCLTIGQNLRVFELWGAFGTDSMPPEPSRLRRAQAPDTMDRPSESIHPDVIWRDGPLTTPEWACDPREIYEPLLVFPPKKVRGKRFPKAPVGDESSAGG